MSELYVGCEVVCVDGSRFSKTSGRPIRSNCSCPVEGAHYTVRDIVASGGILLVEIVNPVMHWRDYYGEINFDPSRFRPIKKGEIEIFRAMCRAKSKENTDA